MGEEEEETEGRLLLLSKVKGLNLSLKEGKGDGNKGSEAGEEK